jgi:PEGA domain
MRQRNDRVKDKASGFEVAPDALDRFFSDAVRAFPSSRPEGDERPVLRALPRIPDNKAETPPIGPVAVLGDDGRSAAAPFDDLPAPSGDAAARGPQSAVLPTPVARQAATPRTNRPPEAPRSPWRMEWRHVAVGILLLVGLAELIVIGWRFASRPSQTAVGALTVTSKPSGAQFLIDGEPVGVTPATVQIPEGIHALEIRSGGPTQVVALRIDKDRGVSRFFDLPVGTSPASVRIDTKPPGARVLVDGKVRGRSPLTVGELNPGQHTVRVERGPQFIQRDLMLESGAQRSLPLEFEPLAGEPTEGHGWLAVSMPVELQAYEKGRLVGTSRAGPWQLEEGSHEIEFINQALGVRVRRTVDVAAGKTATLDVPVPSGLVSVSSTATAEIHIDGDTVGTAPIVNRPLAAGQHDIVARHADLGERRLSVTVSAGTALSVKIDFGRR